MSDDFKKQIFKTEYGSKAIVQRENVLGEPSQMGGKIIRQLGGEYFAEAIAAEGCTYSGSCAVHIYLAPMTRQMQFVIQETTLDQTPADVANAAIRELEAAVKQYYGMKSSKLRSGVY